MPNYYNYSGYPNNIPTVSYTGTGPYASAPAPQYAQPQYQQPQQVNPTMIWVDGEVAARAYQVPPTHPAGQYMALWDNNDMVIYLKSVDAFGRPAPLKKIRYTIEPEPQTGALPTPMNQGGMSGTTEQQDMSKFVTKDDLESLKNELKNMLQTQPNNQNGGQNHNDRGGR